MKKITFALPWTMALLAHNAFAHEGHGLGATHWHATDVLGFVVAAALVALAVYFGNK